MTALTYLIQVNLYLLLFYGLYHLILRNETFFKMNRMYLVGSTLLALAIPLLKAEWIKDLFVTEQIYYATQRVSNTVNEVMISEPVYVDKDYSVQNEAITAGQAFWILYGSITMLFLLNFLRKLYFVNRALKHNSKHQAFSFFNKVVVDEELQGKETIIDHEMVHVKQWHSLDVIYFELFAAFNWFNPIAFYYKKAIKNIHEFIADETAASTLDDKSEYALLLVSNAFGTQPHKLTNSFYNNSLLKTRLIMLNKNKSRKTAILKYGLSVPLFAAMVILSSATIEKSEVLQNVTDKIEAAMPIVMETVTNDAIKVQDSFFEATGELPALEIGNEKGLSDNNQFTNSGLDSVLWYFTKSIKFPYTNDQTQTLGYTFISFELDEKGNFKNPLVLQSLTTHVKEQLTMIMEKAQPFGPGLKGKYVLPIRFTMINESNEKLPSSRGFTKEAFELDNFKEYKVLRELYVNGYAKRQMSVKADSLDVLRNHIMRSTRYPAAALEQNVTGTNFISFEVDNSGAILNPTALKSPAASMQAEVLRVFKGSVPVLNGLEGKYIIPIIFIISGPGRVNIDTAIDMAKYRGYKKLEPVFIRGYVKVKLAEINTEITPGARTRDGLQTLNVKTTVKNDPSEGMQQHLSEFFNRKRTSENGKVYIGFEVLDKKPQNYRIIKSEKPDWEKDLVKHFELYKDTVNVLPGKYYFYMKISEGSESNDRGIMGAINGFQPFFGYGKMTAVSLSISEEDVRGVRSTVNYISVPYLKNPVILVDGKIVKYKSTKKGFRIEPKDYPKNADVKVYQGDKAVELYNESARKRGLIVVTTK